MRKVIFALLVVSLLSPAVLANARTDIQRAQRKVCRLMLAGNVAGFNAYLKQVTTSDFKDYENGQTETCDQMCSQMDSVLSQGKMRMVTSNILSFHQHGDMATATVLHESRGMSIGPDKKRHTMYFRGVSHDQYRKEDGTWKIAEMKWGKETMLMDGKPMPMQAH